MNPKNGNLTFIVLERGTGPYEENEQDSLHIITKIHGIFEDKDWFAVDAVVFRKSMKEGMRVLFLVGTDLIEKKNGMDVIGGILKEVKCGWSDS